MRCLKYVLVLALAMMWSTAPNAFAWSYTTTNGYPVKWWYSPTFHLSTVSFPYGSSFWNAAYAARDSWQYETPALNLTASFSSDGTTWQSGNGVNEMCGTSSYSWGSGTLAVTLRRWNSSTGQMLETDVLFNPAVVWDTDTTPSPTSAYTSMTLTTLHEMGHAFGLNHENRWLASLNQYYPHAGVISQNYWADPHADDIAGLRVVYSSTASARDLTASVYKSSGSGGSNYITGGSATRGSSYPFSFTYGNRGTQQENSINVKFYLSTNSTISTSDVYLGYGTFWITAGAEITYSGSITIPTNISAGTYYFGYLVDASSTISEYDETNNAAPWPLAISVK